MGELHAPQLLIMTRKKRKLLLQVTATKPKALFKMRFFFLICSFVLGFQYLNERNSYAQEFHLETDTVNKPEIKDVKPPEFVQLMIAASSHGIALKSINGQITISDKAALSQCFSLKNSIVCKIDGPTTVLLPLSHNAGIYKLKSNESALCYILKSTVDCEKIYEH